MSATRSVPDERRATRRFGAHALLALVAVALVAVPFSLLVLLVAARSDPLLRLDHDTAESLHRYALGHPGFTDGMRTVSLVGEPVSWWVLMVPVVAWLIYRRLPRLAAFVVVTMLGSSVLNGVVKALVDRARPVLPDPVAHAHGLSFPSGHAQAATVASGVLILVFLPVVARRARVWLYVAGALVIALISFSRIALGVHFLSDVVGGAVIGSAWVLAMTAAFSAWRRDERKPAVRPGEGLEPEQGARLRPGDTATAPPE